MRLPAHLWIALVFAVTCRVVGSRSPCLSILTMAERVGIKCLDFSVALPRWADPSITNVVFERCPVLGGDFGLDTLLVAYPNVVTVTCAIGNGSICVP